MLFPVPMNVAPHPPVYQYTVPTGLEAVKVTVWVEPHTVLVEALAAEGSGVPTL